MNIEKRNLRPASVASYREVIEDFLRRTELADLGKVSAGWLVDYITRRHSSQGSRVKCKRHLMAWLSWCGAQGWAPKVDGDAVAWPEVKVDERRICSLAPAEARGLLLALPEGLRAPAALGLFAGMRPEEVRRLCWEDVLMERKVIQISGAVAKIREARTLDDLPENLWAWLEAHPGKRSGPIVLVTRRMWLEHMRRAKVKAGVANWGPDILRKTFASMAYHLPRGPTHAAEIMGHLRGLQVYLRHYRAVRSAAEARDFFEIKPEVK